MQEENDKVIYLSQLNRYDTLIKRYVDQKTATCIKCVTFDPVTSVMSFYKVTPPLPPGAEPIFQFTLTAKADIQNGDGIDIDDNDIISVKINDNVANGLNVTSDGLELNLAVAPNAEQHIVGSNGAMSSGDKEKIDSIRIATNEELLTVLNG